jgi:phospholipid-binding lipoprotein MlaA
VEPPRRHFTTAAGQEAADKEFAVYDPAEGVNKHLYDFNARLDKYFFIPVVDAYTYVTPEFFRRGVHNFFLNIGEVTNFTNAVFQVNPAKAGTTLGRFVINTTVGLLGTFDPATQIGLERQPEDFGRTLGRWGAAPGAYVVLPVLGPSNVRDTIGRVVDYATLYFIIPDSVKDTTPYDVIAYGVQPVDMRYSNSFHYYDSGSPFEYELVRYIVTQTRELGIAKLRQSR